MSFSGGLSRSIPVNYFGCQTNLTEPFPCLQPPGDQCMTDLFPGFFEFIYFSLFRQLFTRAVTDPGIGTGMLSIASLR